MVSKPCGRDNQSVSKETRIPGVQSLTRASVLGCQYVYGFTDAMCKWWTNFCRKVTCYLFSPIGRLKICDQVIHIKLQFLLSRYRACRQQGKPNSCPISHRLSCLLLFYDCLEIESIEKVSPKPPHVFFMGKVGGSWEFPDKVISGF